MLTPLCFIPTLRLLDSLPLMLRCTFVQTNASDKEKHNHRDFNFKPPESFSDAEGNLILN